MFNQRHARGFTLIEALLTLVIAAVLMASAVPNLRGALERQRLTATTNELVLAVNLARSEATSRRTRAAVAPRSSGNWATGWHVFVDSNDNGMLDAGEAVVRTFDAVPARMTITATFGGFDGHVLSFDYAGLLRRPGSNGMVLGRLTLAADGAARTVCFSAASVRTVRGVSCT